MSRQVEAWSGKFGSDYTDRNPQTPEELDQHYLATFGVTRTELNREFLDQLDRKIRILEVGTNVGTQLRLLESLGFSHLCGVDLQSYALKRAREYAPGVGFVQGAADRLPFADESFDLVFTSGVLIHILPAQIHKVMSEIYRCTRRYVWGWEYYASTYHGVAYRGEQGLLWKGNFAAMYTDRFPDLQLTKMRRVSYLKGQNADAMFLLEKRSD